jgi:hypothetical protein
MWSHVEPPPDGPCHGQLSPRARLAHSARGAVEVAARIAAHGLSLSWPLPPASAEAREVGARGRPGGRPRRLRTDVGAGRSPTGPAAPALSVSDSAAAARTLRGASCHMGTGRSDRADRAARHPVPESLLVSTPRLSPGNARLPPTRAAHCAANGPRALNRRHQPATALPEGSARDVL